MSGVTEQNKMRVMIWRMLGGAVVGAIGTGLFIAFVGKPHMDLENPANMLAIVAGVSYILIGLMVAVGLASPKTGARYLNVEDAEELKEESPKLVPAAVVFILTGIFLLILAMSGTDAAAVVNRETTLITAGACLGGIVIAGWISAKRIDELTRRMGQETAAATFQVTMLLLCVWGALAQLGYVAWLGPLGLLSLVALLQLLASFVIIAQKGMLMPR